MPINKIQEEALAAVSPPSFGGVGSVDGEPAFVAGCGVADGSTWGAGVSLGNA
jgi:hypothetical protein